MVNSPIRLKTLKDFFSSGKLLHFKKGDVVVKLSGVPHDVFYIESGFVIVYRVDPHLNEKVYAIFKPGEIFPLLAVFKKTKEDLCFRALEDLSVYKVDKREFTSFVSSSPSLAQELIEKLATLANLYFERVDQLEIIKTYPKIIARLLFFAKRFGEKSGKEVKIPVQLTDTEVANSVGITRETANRMIRRLQKEGLIYYEDKFMIIKNEEEMANRLQRDTGRSELKNNLKFDQALSLFFVFSPWLAAFLSEILDGAV